MNEVQRGSFISITTIFLLLIKFLVIKIAQPMFKDMQLHIVKVGALALIKLTGYLALTNKIGSLTLIKLTRYSALVNKIGFLALNNINWLFNLNQVNKFFTMDKPIKFFDLS